MSKGEDEAARLTRAKTRAPGLYGAAAGGPDRDSFHVKVAGVSHYQDAVRRVKPGDRCVLTAETDNQYDPHAIRAACRVDGREETIGYLPKCDGNVILGGLMASEGVVVTATVDGVGKPAGSPFIGVSLLLTVTYPKR